MEVITSNIELIIVTAINVGILLQRTRTLEKVLNETRKEVTSLRTETRDSQRVIHTRINNNNADINRHEGVLQTVVPHIRTESPRRLDIPSPAGAR